MRRLLLALALAIGCPAEPPPPPSGPRYTLRLVRAGRDPAAVTAAVVSLTGHAPRIAAELVARGQVPILVAVPAEEAERGRAALAAAGAEVLVGEVPR